MAAKLSLKLTMAFEFVILALFILCSQTVFAQKTCCLRTIAPTTNVSFDLFPSKGDCPSIDFIPVEGKMDWDEIVDKIGRIAGAKDDPESSQIRAMLLDIDYLLIWNLIIDESKNSYNLYIQLFDHHRNKIVKDGQASWISYDPEKYKDNAKKIMESFTPLDATIYDYERIPEQCQVKPEKDKIEAGEKMKINLKIQGNDGTPSQPWQWVLVKVEKGKITNGIPQWEGEDLCHRFEVANGLIDVEYQAPEECKDAIETIQVFNSCYNDPLVTENLALGKEIGIGNFNIICNRLELYIRFYTNFGRTRIPLQIDEQDPYKVTGQGKIVVDTTFTDEDGAFESFKFNMDIILDGKIDSLYDHLSLKIHGNIKKDEFLDTSPNFKASGSVFPIKKTDVEFEIPLKDGASAKKTKLNEEVDAYLWTFILYKKAYN